MPMKCCVPTCRIQTDDKEARNVSFHRLPALNSLKEAWLDQLNKYFHVIDKKYMYICSQHFSDCFMYSGLCQKRKLKPGSVPTIFLNADGTEVEERQRPPPIESVNASADVIKSDSVDTQDFNRAPIVEKILDPLISSFEKKIEKQKDDNTALRLRNKILQQRLVRTRKRINDLSSVLGQMKRKKYISSAESTILEDSVPAHDREILEGILHRKHSKTRFPCSLRKFACTLHFYSPKAYKYVRKTSMKSLPHPMTISKWHAKIHCQSGISKASIAAVKTKVDEAKKTVFGNLVIDEMAIKTKIETVNGNEYGYVDLGKGIQANNVIVSMLVCVNGKWKIPISYYFIRSVNGKQKADIIIEALTALHETGVQIVSLTFDGASSNLSMCRELGAKSSIDEGIQNYFYHPFTKQPVFIINDACHCLKCIRNSLGKNDKDMYDAEGNVISWSYFKSLVDCKKQHAELYLANKVNQQHLDWQRNPMNVRLAAQTFSKSVSDALRYLEFETDIREFKGAQGTSKFCEIINEAFDLLNSRQLYCNDKSKISGIHSGNIEYARQRVRIITEYIRGLRYLDGAKIIHSQRRTGFVGIILALHSVLDIYDHHVKNEGEYLLSYKLSQDHLEIFFSAVRSKGGYSNNPTCRQFASIFKKLLLHADIEGSDSANCLLLDDTVDLKVSQSFSLCNPESKENCSVDDNINKTEMLASLSENRQYVHDAVVYIAGFIVRSILRRSKCFTCSFLLTHQSDSLDSEDNRTAQEYRSKLTDIKDRGGLIRPSVDVISICKISEKVFKLHYSPGKGTYKQLIKAVQQKIPRSVLQIKHALSNKVNESCHRAQLIRIIVSKYLQMRINYYESQTRQPVKRIRRLYTKYILFNSE